MDLLLKKNCRYHWASKRYGRAISMAFAKEGVNLALLGRDIGAIEPVVEHAEHLAKPKLLNAMSPKDTW